MILITHLLAEEPEKLSGRLLANTCHPIERSQRMAKGEFTLEMGNSIKGKGTIIQGVSAVHVFYEILSQPRSSVLDP
ncbi:unnamed protein product, partial [Musa textilis]